MESKINKNAISTQSVEAARKIDGSISAIQKINERLYDLRLGFLSELDRLLGASPTLREHSDMLPDEADTSSGELETLRRGLDAALSQTIELEEQFSRLRSL